MARKPAALARELLRNFPKGRRGKSRRRRKGSAETQPQEAGDAVGTEATDEVEEPASETEESEVSASETDEHKEPVADAEEAA